MIKKEQNKWVLYTHDGKKRLGEFATEQEAIHREKQINFMKHEQDMKKKSYRGVKH